MRVDILETKMPGDVFVFLDEPILMDRPVRHHGNYAAPNLTETNFDTPGSCMVTP